MQSGCELGLIERLSGTDMYERLGVGVTTYVRACSTLSAGGKLPVFMIRMGEVLYNAPKTHRPPLQSASWMPFMPLAHVCLGVL